METNKGTRVIAVIALVVAVVGVSLGFAAFSSNLSIKPQATVTPDDSTFDVNFSSTDTTPSTSAIVAVTDPNTVVATNATINNTGEPVISGLSATFTEPGQKATYTFYAHNAGQYAAYLRSISYKNAESASAPKVCTAISGTTQSLVDSACGDIELTVKVGSESAVNGTTTNIRNHSLAKGGFEPIVVEIKYNENASSSRADGDFTVKFGDIALNYSSVDAQ